MRQLQVDFMGGTRSTFGIDRLDRDEVDQFLEDVALTGGGVLVTDDGPFCLPAGGHGVTSVRVLVPGEQWLENREDIEEPYVGD